MPSFSFFGVLTGQKGLRRGELPENYKMLLNKIDCKTVRISAYSSTREQSNKRCGTRLNGRVRLARFAHIRVVRHVLPISLLILRKKPTVSQSINKTTPRYFRGYKIKIQSLIEKQKSNTFPVATQWMTCKL